MAAVAATDTGTAGALLDPHRNIGPLVGVAVFAGIPPSTCLVYTSYAGRARHR